MTTGEGRTALCAWARDLLNLEVKKIEDCGTGAVYCQVIDSIYRDVPLSKVKFDAKHEYEYIQNFKVLQGAFDKHKIDNFIPVERLVKCKMQDNLEFMQWLKKYWDTYFPGGHYDAAARRKGLGAASSGTLTDPSLKKSSSNGSVNRSRFAPSSTKPTATKAHVGMAGSQEVEEHYRRMIEEMNQNVMELQVTVEGLEKERDFYFGKLREIEVAVQQEIEAHPDSTSAPVLKQVQQIMYRTEEGFEAPAAETAEGN